MVATEERRAPPAPVVPAVPEVAEVAEVCVDWQLCPTLIVEPQPPKVLTDPSPAV